MIGEHLLVHYHLRPGGVTTVLREQARALQSLGIPVRLLSGEAPPPGADGFPAPVEVIPQLAYRESPLPPDGIADALARLLRFAEPGGLHHFHNPTLGKNPSWMTLIHGLAERGRPLLLQVHDFGEDGRWTPDGWPRDHERYYPTGISIRWIVLHPVDRAVLVKAGVPPDEVRVLVNAVSPPGYGDLPPSADGIPRVLYPARGIRRKNLGEFLLLAALAPRDWEFRTTLPPIGAIEERHFRRWEKWARHLGIKVMLGRGAGSFRPDLVLSTSVREGFGYAFAEPLLCGIPGTGRLPGRWLCGNDGEPLPFPVGLYRAVRVPDVILRRLREGKELPDRAADEKNDFAALPEHQQRRVLRQAVGNPELVAGQICLEMWDGTHRDVATWFRDLMAISGPQTAALAERVADAFSGETMGHRLRGIAGEARRGSGGLRGHANASMVAEAFTKPKDRIPHP